MPDQLLKNTATLGGTYNGGSFLLDSNETETDFVSGLTIVKSAPALWTTGNLLFTVTVTNNADFELTAAQITDAIDTTIATLVDDTVQIDGADVPYGYDSGLLTVNITSLAVGQTKILTFQVAKV